MILPLDQQMIGRYCEVMRQHQHMPVYTSALSESMASESMIDRALAGQLTHIMYVKNGRIYVGWWDSVDFQWFFDCYGT